MNLDDLRRLGYKPTLLDRILFGRTYWILWAVLLALNLMTFSYSIQQIASR